MKREKAKSLSAIICESLPKDLHLSIELAKEKGAFIWLSSVPVQEHGFSLHKAAFHDALSLRYGWKPTNMPSECICGNSFTVDHAFSCVRGEFPSLRHNKIRDITADLVSRYVTTSALNQF